MVFNTYKDHITRVNENIGMPEGKNEEILNICEKLVGNADAFAKFKAIEDRFFAGDETTHKDVVALSEEMGLEKFMFTLTVLEMYSLRTLQLYKVNDYPMDVYYDSLIDLVIWSKTCATEHGVFGINNYGWVSYQVMGRMFRIGRMQFHFIEYKAPEYTHAGVTVKPGQTVINIHIPEGDSFTKEKRLDSYRRAYKFLKQTGHAVFVCESWLLYPGQRDFLHEKSNIRDFMDDFYIVEYKEEFCNFADKWRVFGFRDSYAPETLPRNTKLQQAYAKRLEEGGATGCGYGVFIFDGENIL